MLFGYPIDAVVDNWLHDCLHAILISIHEKLAEGKEVKEWSEIIPPPFLSKLESRLKGRGALGKMLTNYQSALSKLSTTERDRVIRAFDEQNKIDSLLSCQCDCESIEDLPLAIREPASALFKYAFDILEGLEIRKNHYSKIYRSIPSRICPFCGDENFSSLGSRGSRRESLDHYLLKDSYPFAAANLLNLVPMGHKCNSLYKGTKDILYKNKGGGVRRKVFNPYNHFDFRVSLVESQPFAGRTGVLNVPLPEWKIKFYNTSEDDRLSEDISEKIETWEDVFSITDRYRNLLDDEFTSWLEIFGKWCKRRDTDFGSNQALISAMDDYASDYELCGFGERAFLKAAMFRMLKVHFQEDNQRFIEFVKVFLINVSD